jgi:membrane protease YdiL (CAAX protease family)
MNIAKKAGWLILVVIVLYLLFSILLPAYTGTEDLLQLYSLNALFVSILAMYIPAIWFMRKYPGRNYGLKRISFAGVLLCVMLGVSAFLLSTGIAGFLSIAAEALNLRDISTPLPGLSGWRAPAAIFIICVVPAITEEQLFRGVLLGAWRPKGRKTAIWVSSVLFALMHGDPLMIPPILALSWLLGALCYDTGSVYPSMIVHFTNNLITLILSELLSQAASETAAVTADVGQVLLSSAIYTGLGLLFVFVYYKRLLRALKGSEPEKTGEASNELNELNKADDLYKQADADKTGVFLPVAISMILLLGLVIINYLYMAGVIA